MGGSAKGRGQPTEKAFFGKEILCETAIENLRYKSFGGKNFGCHHGTIWVLTLHEEVPGRYCGDVYMTIKGRIWGILGTMVVPKNIFVWKSDI